MMQSINNGKGLEVSPICAVRAFEISPPNSKLTNRSTSPQHKRQGRKQSPSKVPLSTPRDQHEHDNGKNSHKPSTNGIFGSQKTFGSIINSFINFGKTASGGLVVGTRNKTSRVGDALGTNGDTGDHKKLEEGPRHGHEGRCDDDGSCGCL